MVLSPDTLDPAVFDPEVMPTVFYPGTPDTAAAEPINLRAGDVVASIDLTLMHVPSFHVRGRIATDGPAPPVRVQLRAAESGPAVQIPGTDVRVDGMFDLSRVPPGRYILFAQTVDQGPARMMMTVPVTVTDRDVEGISVTFNPNVTITGHLTIDGRRLPAAFLPRSCSCRAQPPAAYGAALPPGRRLHAPKRRAGRLPIPRRRPEPAGVSRVCALRG